MTLDLRKKCLKNPHLLATSAHPAERSWILAIFYGIPEKSRNCPGTTTDFKQSRRRPGTATSSQLVRFHRRTPAKTRRAKKDKNVKVLP